MGRIKSSLFIPTKHIVPKTHIPSSIASLFSTLTNVVNLSYKKQINQVYLKKIIYLNSKVLQIKQTLTTTKIK